MAMTFVLDLTPLKVTSPLVPMARLHVGKQKSSSCEKCNETMRE